MNCGRKNVRASLYIQDDCWIEIVSYGNKADLGRIACVSKTVGKIANESGAWFGLCKFLWHNKQNHPLERWVSMSSSASPSNRRKVQQKSNPRDLSRIESTILELEGSKEIILKEMKENQQYFPENGENMEFENSVQLKRFKELLAYKDTLEARLIIWNNNKTQCLDKMNNSSFSSCQESNNLQFVRQAAPISRAVRAQWIRHTEGLYFDLLEEIEAFQKELEELVEESEIEVVIATEKAEKEQLNASYTNNNNNSNNKSNNNSNTSTFDINIYLDFLKKEEVSKEVQQEVFCFGYICIV